MTEQLLNEAIKRSLLALVDEHKARCENPECPVNTTLMGVLLDKANIGVTPEEARRFF